MQADFFGSDGAGGAGRRDGLGHGGGRNAAEQAGQGGGSNCSNEWRRRRHAWDPSFPARLKLGLLFLSAK